MSKTYAVIAGGGTGGHVYPALAIAEALIARGYSNEEILFVGSTRGLEARIIPDAGHRIKLLPGRGISRKPSVESLEAIGGLAKALFLAFRLLMKEKPKVVVSVGGYAAAPCAFAAVALRIPLVVAESNAIPGAVHRIVGRFAAANAVALPGTALPNAVVTGNPLRGVFANFERGVPAKARARNELGISTEPVVIAIFGGSLGARSINIAAIELAKAWADVDNVKIRHVVGSRDWISRDPELDHESVQQTNPNYEAVEYEPNMARLLSAADIAVCRSGATTIAELSAAGIASVLIPFPFAAGDHQSANARILEEVGAARVIKDRNCSGKSLIKALLPLVGSKTARDSAANAAKKLAVPGAAERVADLVERNATS